MQSQRNICSWSRVVVLAWASLWMLVVPLFHVHPEADHRHGEAGHVHGGTIHTVWSPDLDCEFATHGNFKKTVSGPAQFTHSGDGHTEFGLSLLTDSTDRNSSRPFLVQALESSSAIVLHETGPVRLERNTIPLLSAAHFSLAIAPRAPPHLI